MPGASELELRIRSAPVTNVVLVVAEIRRRSPVLEALEKKGSIKIAGAMYDLATGVVQMVG
jgi:carbonic anhydrase